VPWAPSASVTLVALPQAIELEPHAACLFDAQDLPQPRQHHDQFGIDVRPGKADRLDVDLMELAVAPALRPLVAEQRPHRPQPSRRLVGEVVLHDRAHHPGGEFRPQRELLAVEPVLEGVHLLLDDVGDLADALDEQLGGLDDRRADLLVAVAAQPVGYPRLEPLPQRRVRRQQIVHAAHGGELPVRHGAQADARA